MEKLKRFYEKNKKNPHFWIAITWAVLSIPTLLLWKDSVMWVAIMSIYANIAASLAAMEAKDDE